MTKLSVNINKIALIRNSRGGNYPDLIQVAIDCESFGAEGITIHPRPDERHIRFRDIPLLKEVVRTELNIEGNPTDVFMKAVLKYRPHQCTLVPDKPGALTSDHGYDTIKEKDYLMGIVDQLKSAGVRVSIFLDPDPMMVEGAREIGADRIELYTGPYAALFKDDPDKAIENHLKASRAAREAGLGINAGHDLNLENLQFYASRIPDLLEVSIGHALITDALYYGLGNVIPMYKQLLQSQNAFVLS